MMRIELKDEEVSEKDRLNIVDTVEEWLSAVAKGGGI